MASESLAVRYRPSDFPEMIGQKLNATVLAKMVDSKDVPTGLLFSGPSGSGKTTAARILAAKLDGEVLEIDAASNGGVAEVRKLIDTLRYSSGSEYRVVIVDEAQSMTREAYNALLKTLEEPPAGTVFVLVTTEPEKIPEAVLTRLMEFEFRRVTPAEIFDRLTQIAEAESIQAEADLLLYLAQTSNGNVRAAITSLDMIRLASITTVDEYRKAQGAQDVGPVLVAALSTGDHAKIFSTVDKLLAFSGNPTYLANELLATLRDMTVVRAGGTLPIEGRYTELRKDLALRIEPERVLAAMKTLWDLKTRVRGADNPRGNLELALILIADVFTRGKAPAPAPKAPTPAKTAPVAPPATEQKKLTLAQLAQDL